MQGLRFMPQNAQQSTNRHVKSEILRGILIGCGWLFIAAGCIGIFLPLVPTVPFLLLAAACFARSSERFHSWLIEHDRLGPLIREYLHHGRIPLRAKRMAIGMVWISFPASAYLFVPVLWLKIVLLVIAASITLYLLALPTAPPADSNGGHH